MAFDLQYKVYRSDWQGEQFARKVRNNVAAVSALGWSDTGFAPGNDPVASMNRMPQSCKPRLVHLATAAGRRVSLAIATNDAPIYSMEGQTLSYNPDSQGSAVTWTVEGFTGEKRSLVTPG